MNLQFSIMILALDSNSTLTLIIISVLLKSSFLMSMISVPFVKLLSSVNNLSILLSAIVTSVPILFCFNIVSVIAWVKDTMAYWLKKTFYNLFSFIFKLIYNSLIYRYLRMKLFFTLCHNLGRYVFK